MVRFTDSLHLTIAVDWPLNHNPNNKFNETYHFGQSDILTTIFTVQPGLKIRVPN